MIFNQILLHILAILKNERTVSSAYHLVRGKRSGQTVQDVGMYKLHAYFGILPKLKREVFDQAIHELQQQGLIIEENGFYRFENELQLEPLPFYNGWHYRGNEHKFFSRLSILIETLSHVKNDILFFAPTDKSVEAQSFIRGYLKHVPFRDESFRLQLMNEVELAIEQADLLEIQREIFVTRLSGVNVAGLTWQQLAQKFKMSELDIQLLFISSLQAVLEGIRKQEYKLLREISTNLYIELPLSDSTAETARLFNEGKSVEQIAQIRRLKQSTIEDHLVEIVMNIPSFTVTAFLTNEQLQEINDAAINYDTKKLRVLKEVLPEYSYFQLRLALAKGVN